MAAFLLLALGGLGAGCGPVRFVPSPYTPQNVDLVYSAQEDISVVRWRIASTEPAGADLSFQILEADGYRPLDFSQSLYPGGPSACADGAGTCFQFVVRGHYTVPDGARPIQALHTLYGVLPGALATTETAAQTLDVSSFFHTNNDQVYVSITDLVASDGPYVYPRAYERSMWPTNGLCVSDAQPDGVSFSPLDPDTWGFPPDTPLSDSGIYCVGVRPVPNDGAAGALAQTRVATVPEVVDLQQTFTPPVQASPVIYQIVLDLEIPIADRCQAAIKKIEWLVDNAMMTTAVPVPVIELSPPINLALDPKGTDGAGACAQQDGRTLDASAMAEEVFKTVASYPQVNQQFHFFYFNNLDSPLPPTLTDALTQLFEALQAPPPPYQLTTLSRLFNPGVASVTGPTWWMSQPSWTGPDDPALSMWLTNYVQQTLPYESQVYDAATPVPLLSSAQAAQYAGGQIKICTAAPLVTATDMGGSIPSNDAAWSWPILAMDPPAYTVNLPVQQAAPYASFSAASAAVHAQVCTRYCDNHPYISTAGVGVTSWSGDPSCAGDD